jgi:hypothetical protein
VPQFYNKENLAHNPGLGSFVAPQLSIEYTLVPEPSAAAALLALGGATALARRGCRRRSSPR